jgi:signal transduction histidine kinase
VHRADRRRVRDRVRATLAGRLSRPIDVLFLRHDHAPLRVEVDARRVMAHGRPSTLVVVRDLSARLQVEEERERLLAVAEAARTEATRMLAQVRRLSTQLVQAQESERRAIARELHDEIGQCVTGLSFTLEAAARGPPEPVLASARTQTRELIQRVRSLSLELRPGMLDDLGLLAALTWHMARFGEQTGIQVGFAHAGLDRRFSSEVETAAYRIVQAALTNVARHAACTTASVRAWATSGLVGVQIEDSGAGFAVEPVLARGETTGISGMRERARLLGGDLAIESTIGYGTRVTATLPLRNP